MCYIYVCIYVCVYTLACCFDEFGKMSRWRDYEVNFTLGVKSSFLICQVYAMIFQINLAMLAFLFKHLFIADFDMALSCICT